MINMKAERPIGRYLWASPNDVDNNNVFVEGGEEDVEVAQDGPCDIGLNIVLVVLEEDHT